MKIGYINGLRGLAILMVIWEHWYSRSFEAHAPAFLDPLVSAGNYGVEIFFVLSGFVLYLPYCNGRPFVARTYLVHRARRLLPLFYVALFASAALHRDNPFPYALLLYPNPQSIGPIFNFPLWSISAEILVLRASPRPHLPDALAHRPLPADRRLAQLRPRPGMVAARPPRHALPLRDRNAGGRQPAASPWQHPLPASRRCCRIPPRPVRSPGRRPRRRWHHLLLLAPQHIAPHAGAQQ